MFCIRAIERTFSFIEWSIPSFTNILTIVLINIHFVYYICLFWLAQILLYLYTLQNYSNVLRLVVRFLHMCSFYRALWTFVFCIISCILHVFLISKCLALLEMCWTYLCNDSNNNNDSINSVLLSSTFVYFTIHLIDWLIDWLIVVFFQFTVISL